MFKQLVVALFFLVGSFCYSAEIWEGLDERECQKALHIGCGNAYLLLHKPCRALESFQKASNLLDRSEEVSPVIRFLILFGKAVAYDCLGFDANCKQSIGEMCLIASEFDEEDEESPSEDTQKDDACRFIVNFFHDVASVAPTDEVRHLLVALVDNVVGELVTNCGLQQFFSEWELEEWDHL